MTGEKKIPLRRCVGCGKMMPKNKLLRVILTPEGEIKAGAVGRQNGRGAYICRSPECLKKAEETRGLERSLKRRIPNDVYRKLKEEMTVS